MNKHQHFNRNALQKKDNVTGHANLVCKEFGCNKVLSPTESLYSDYCFHHASMINQSERAKAKLFNGYTYKYVLYRWDAANNKWEQKFEEVIIYDQYFQKPISEDFKDDPLRLFYRYDLFCDYQCTDTVYSYSPNLFRNV